MNTIYELKFRAKLLRAQLDENSISPEHIGALLEDTLSYLGNFEQLSDSLGIRKIYGSKIAMEQDASPVGGNKKPLRFGQLVVINSGEGNPDNGDIYAFQNPKWLHIGNLTEITQIVKSVSELNQGHQSLTNRVTTNTQTIGEHSSKLERLEVHNVPATHQRDGYMTSQMVLDLESTANVVGQLMSTEIYGSSTENSFTITLQKDYLGASSFNIPVHGGDDGITPAPTVGLITNEGFSILAYYKLRQSDFEKFIQFIPTYLVEYNTNENLVVEKGGPDFPIDGLIYHSPTNRILLRSVVHYEKGPEYYYHEICSEYDEVGLPPMSGKIYLCKNRTFVGVSNGLCELFKTENQ